MAHLAQRFGFYLAHTLAGHVENAAHFLECARVPVAKSEAEPQHLFFDACVELVRADDCLKEALEKTHLAIQHKILLEARAALQHHKQREAQRSFDDLLSDAGNALRDSALAVRLGKRHPV